MSYSGIEHKLRVFISSKCGGKYTVARKSLQKLLEVTGIASLYTVLSNQGAKYYLTSYIQRIHRRRIPLCSS